MVRGCARIDSRLDTAKIGSAGRVEVHHAWMLAVIRGTKNVSTRAGPEADVALAMFKLIAIEDVQHAGEGRVVCLHYIPNGPGSVCKNRHDEARIFVA